MKKENHFSLPGCREMERRFFFYFTTVNTKTLRKQHAIFTILKKYIIISL